MTKIKVALILLLLVVVVEEKVVVVVVVFESESCYVVQACLKLITLLPQPAKC